MVLQAGKGVGVVAVSGADDELGEVLERGQAGLLHKQVGGPGPPTRPFKWLLGNKQPAATDVHT